LAESVQFFFFKCKKLGLPTESKQGCTSDKTGTLSTRKKIIGEIWVGFNKQEVLVYQDNTLKKVNF
jgi:hypothetical protein